MTPPPNTHLSIQAIALPLLAGGFLSLTSLAPAPAQAAAKGASGPSFEVSDKRAR